MAKKRIGIDALFQTSVPAAVPSEPPPTQGEYRDLEVDRIRPGAHQPRRHFDDESMEKLVASIRTQGVLQPLLVRPVASPDGFELVAGERRWRAARAAGLSTVPVRVVELDDRQALLVAVTENLQREDLSPIEEAEGYLDLLRANLENEPGFAIYQDEADPHSGVVRLLRALNNRVAGNSKDNVVLTLEPRVQEVFATVGRTTWASFVAHRLPLLNLPPEVMAAVRSNQIPYTKARLIARLTAERLGCDESQARRTRRDLVDQAITEGLSVRGLQAEIARLLGPSAPEPSRAAPAHRRSGLAGRMDQLKARLDETNLDDLGPARRDEVASAIEALLKLL